jgi:hypothetical protein
MKSNSVGASGIALMRTLSQLRQFCERRCGVRDDTIGNGANGCDHRLTVAAQNCPRLFLAWVRRSLVAFCVLTPGITPAAQACVDVEALAQSTGHITRYFDPQETQTASGLVGIRATAWFLSKTIMVTAEHVAAAMDLSDETWKPVEIRLGEIKQARDVRIGRIAGSHSEKIAVLELREEFLSATGLPIRMEPVVAEEQVATIAYPGNRLRFVRGRFVRYGDGDKFAGTALLEMYDGNDRLVLDHGASGAPVLDCQGRVVAVVSNIFTQTLQFPSQAIRVSTAWGTPNVISIPIQVLQEFSQSQ